MIDTQGTGLLTREIVEKRNICKLHSHLSKNKIIKRLLGYIRPEVGCG